MNLGMDSFGIGEALKGLEMLEVLAPVAKLLRGKLNSDIQISGKLNDDFTPMAFVVWLLKAVFNQDEASAMALMLTVHNEGKGACGSYTFDVAQSKAMEVRALAEKSEYPLACQVEKAMGDL